MCLNYLISFLRKIKGSERNSKWKQFNQAWKNKTSIKAKTISYRALKLNQTITQMTLFTWLAKFDECRTNSSKCLSATLMKLVNAKGSLITTRKERMIRHEKHIITLCINFSSINSRSWALTVYIFLHWLQEFPGSRDTHLPKSNLKVRELNHHVYFTTLMHLQSETKRIKYIVSIPSHK
jgi:hypothetical protein